MLNKVFKAFKSVNEALVCGLSIKIAVDQYCGTVN